VAPWAPCKLKLFLYLNPPSPSITNILVSVVPCGIEGIVKLPVIETEPVNWCVLESDDPNTVEPVT
jgi:hypothetical protein